jgi:hypothetical protein
LAAFSFLKSFPQRKKKKYRPKSSLKIHLRLLNKGKGEKSDRLKT